MAVGPSPLASCAPFPWSSFPAPVLPVLPLSSLPPLSLFSCLFPFPFPCPYHNPLNPAMRSGERCKLPQRVRESPAAKRFWCIFRLKSAHLIHCHNDTFVIFTVPFGCVQRRHNKILVGETCPHNFLAVGASRPHRSMESAPVVTTNANGQENQGTINSAPLNLVLTTGIMALYKCAYLYLLTYFM